MESRAGGQRWLVSWHPPEVEPAGRPHGAAGACVAGDRLVLISHDGTHWGFPAGRPDGDESAEETLRREVWEEACARVETARLLGHARSECVAGHEAGLVLVRSYWRAEVEVLPWRPRFEIAHRRLVPAAEAAGHVRDPDPVGTRIAQRALLEAALAAPPDEDDTPPGRPGARGAPAHDS
ncbi:NUDIX hydrolase [Phytohabitans kaempferiae]|uniref:NUDIX hydrolase n=1 Tax=Phytohabitans kaempferiae TaxID=1620943 RepID=A0ABV6LYP9_9ACTN